MLLSLILFQAYFHLFAYLCGTKQGEFDASGHLTCGIIASCIWLSIKQLVNECTPSFYPGSTLNIVSKLSSVMIVYHAYTLIFTVSIYHNVLESVIGYLFALAIFIIAIYFDNFSDCTFYIMAKLTFLRALSEEFEKRTIVQRILQAYNK